LTTAYFSAQRLTGTGRNLQMQYFKIHVKRWYSWYNLSLAEQNSSENVKKIFYVTGMDVIGRYALQFALS
jgi:hypothetical protein